MGMIPIVSDILKGTDNYKEFIVVDSFKELNEKGLDKSDCLIYHHCSSEIELNIGIELESLSKKGMRKFIYICSKETGILASIRMFISSKQGIILDDEFYFENEDELKYLVDEGWDDYAHSIVESHSDISVISDFYTTYLRGNDGALSVNKFYLDRVGEAIENVSKEHKITLQQMQDMSNTASSLFGSAGHLIDNLVESRDKLVEQVGQLEDAIKTTESQQSRVRMRNDRVSIYPTVPYSGANNILYIREISPVYALTSFLLAYVNYLINYANKRVRLIFMHTKSSLMLDKYDSMIDGMTYITSESMHNESMLDHTYIHLDTPKREIINRLLNRNSFDLTIVVDRYYANRLITGRAHTLFAVSGQGDVRREGLRWNECITSIRAPKSVFISIPAIKGYPTVLVEKYSRYARECQEMFDKLSEFADVDI